MATASLTGQQVLDNTLIASIVEDLKTRADQMRPLRFLDRVPVVDAADDEITGIWTGNRYAADIIANDQKAVTVSAGRLELYVTNVPNIKIGARLNQADLNRLEKLQQAGAADADNALYDFWFSVLEDRIEGVRQRENALVCQMMIGNVDYDRWGIQVASAFNMPADMKVQVSVLWSDATNATPIKNVQQNVAYWRQKYGRNFDRVTMSRTDFLNVIATAEFKNLAQQFYGIASTAVVNTTNETLNQGYLGRLLGMAVEVEDHTYITQENDGREVYHRDMPEGTVLISATEDDGDRRVMDLANAEVTEKMVADMTGMPVGIGGQARGPVGYWTPTTGDLNPPGVTCWAVARAFPRRKVKQATAVLIVA
jgi:hypothetical protein